jgi:hypothetical protein
LSTEDSSNLSPIALEQIAKRAINFQQYIFRRAWGIYYAIWAAAYVVFAFGWEIPFQSLLPSYLIWVPYALLYGGVGWAAGIATVVIFGNARRYVFLREAVGSYPRWEKSRYALMIGVWVAFDVAIATAFEFYPHAALTILFGLLFAVDIFIYYWLRLSFPDKLPLEAKIALYSYGISVAISFLSSLFSFPTFFAWVSVTWGALIGVWIFCALYALWHSSEDLVDSVY